MDFSESFDKSDGAGFGVAWTEEVAGAGTVGGKAQATTAGVNAQSVVTTSTDTPDQYVGAYVTTVGTLHYCDAQLIFRYTDQNNYYAILRGFSNTYGGQCYIFRKVVGGVLTDVEGVARSFTDPEYMRVEVEGANIRLYFNEVQADSWTDTDLTAGGRVGLGFFRSSTASTRLIQVDGFVAGDLTAYDHTVFDTTYPGTITLGTDGTPNIVVSNGFYTFGSTTGWRCVGARVYIPAAITTLTSPIPVGLWPYAGTNNGPDLTQPAVRSGLVLPVSGGWNEVRWEPLEVIPGEPFWVGYDLGGGRYMAAGDLSTGFIQASDGSSLVLAEENIIAESGFLGSRAYFRIGTNPQTDGDAFGYGIDVLIDEGGGTPPVIESQIFYSDGSRVRAYVLVGGEPVEVNLLDFAV